MDADFDGHVWAFGWSQGTATVIDVDDESTDLVLDDCGGGPCGDYMYMRGDLSGLHMHNAQGDLGSYATLFEGCDDGETDWTTLSVDDVVPDGASLGLVAQSADDLASLAGAQAVPLPEPDADGAIDVAAAFDAAGATQGRILSVRATFRSGAGGAPTLRQIGAEHCCNVILQ
jgi:hypothetical protein